MKRGRDAAGLEDEAEVYSDMYGFEWAAEVLAVKLNSLRQE